MSRSRASSIGACSVAVSSSAPSSKLYRDLSSAASTPITRSPVVSARLRRNPKWFRPPYHALPGTVHSQQCEQQVKVNQELLELRGCQMTINLPPLTSNKHNKPLDMVYSNRWKLSDNPALHQMRRSRVRSAPTRYLPSWPDRDSVIDPIFLTRPNTDIVGSVLTF